MQTAVKLSTTSIEHWHLHVELERPLHLMDSHGSMLRGAFGHALKAIACRCGSEIHTATCIYQSIFEPLVPADWPARYQNCPPAFVVSQAADNTSRIKHLKFAFTLLGPALMHRELIWRAWGIAATKGFGQLQIPGRLTLISQATQPEQFGAARQLNLRLTSPLLLKRKVAGQSASQPLTVDELTCSDLLIALHRRLQITHLLYQTPATALPALDDWLALTAQIQFTSQLHEVHFARRSNRQQKRMPLFGLMGNIHLSGLLDSSLLDALSIGQWLHIGGKTALGLGGYRLYGHTSPVLHLSSKEPF
jgi:hypothetical protein